MIHNLITDMMMSEGDTKRIDCPSCGGRHTFTVSIKEGKAVWNCYKASCRVRGAAPVALSRNDLEKRVYKSYELTPQSNIIYDRPTNFSSFFPKKMTRYMDKNNVTESWREGRVDLYHDVVQDRCVFIIKSSGKPVDAVGRALGRGTKWHRYKSTGEPFLSGTGEVMYIVEDAASACAVSKYGVGMALLGTSMSDRALEIAKTYSSCVVCLDRDASKKSLALTIRLKQYTKATMRLLKADPKEYPEGVLV